MSCAAFVFNLVLGSRRVTFDEVFDLLERGLPSEIVKLNPKYVKCKNSRIEELALLFQFCVLRFKVRNDEPLFKSGQVASVCRLVWNCDIEKLKLLSHSPSDFVTCELQRTPMHTRTIEFMKLSAKTWVVIFEEGTGFAELLPELISSKHLAGLFSLWQWFYRNERPLGAESTEKALRELGPSSDYVKFIDYTLQIEHLNPEQRFDYLMLLPNSNLAAFFLQNYNGPLEHFEFDAVRKMVFKSLLKATKVFTLAVD